jgi:hypothetical protein
MQLHRCAVFLISGSPAQAGDPLEDARMHAYSATFPSASKPSQSSLRPRPLTLPLPPSLLSHHFLVPSSSVPLSVLP